MKTLTITSELREEILSLQIPKEQRRRHSVEFYGRRQNRRYACGSKRSYTFEYAREVVKRFRRYHNQMMNAYRCRHCQSWHVGRPTESI